MKFLVAPNAFKGTILAEKAASIIGEAILQQYPHVQVEASPIADGGDGTCDLLANQLQLQKNEAWALNAIGRPVKGYFFLNSGQKTAFLDVSNVSGIQQLKTHEKDALLTSTYGSGELIRYAVEMGAEHIVLGLGGSATVDMGTGILRALGFLFLDEKGRELPLFSDAFLSKIAFIQRPLKLASIEFTCLCDVRNPFFGTNGAIPVFGPQKGLKAKHLAQYEEDATRFYLKLQQKSPFDLKDKPGFGAAGGIALGLSAFFPVSIEEGAQFFFKQVKMADKVKNSEYVITGEGRFDSQSAEGKGSYELLKLTKQFGKKVILVTSGDEGAASGFDHVIRLPDLDFDSPELKTNAESNLFQSVNHYLREKFSVDE